MSEKKQKTIFIVHQNIPAQFRNLAPSLVADGHHVYFITAGKSDIAGVKRVQYQIDAESMTPDVSIFAYAQKAARAALYLREKLNVLPDLIIGHAGWGELMFLRDLYPGVPIIGYFEWFHGMFSPEPREASDPPNPDGPFVLRTKNFPNYVTADIATVGITPTWWQYSTFPSWIQNKLNVLFDGTDTIKIRRQPNSILALPNGKVVSSHNEIVTYVSRSLEPIRGFPTALRAIGLLCKMRPNCQFIIVGREKTSYGNPLLSGESHKAKMLREVDIDPDRVHFVGNVDYETFLRILYISSVHIYLTAPFILSWSLMEAMAAECLIVGSRTPPVEEVIVDGHNGLLVEFSDPVALATKVADALERPDQYHTLRKEARRTILERYDLHGICLPRQKALINSLL